MLLRTPTRQEKRCVYVFLRLLLPFSPQQHANTNKLLWLSVQQHFLKKRYTCPPSARFVWHDHFLSSHLSHPMIMIERSTTTMGYNNCIPIWQGFLSLRPGYRYIQGNPGVFVFYKGVKRENMLLLAGAGYAVYIYLDRSTVIHACCCSVVWAQSSE